MQSIEVAGVTVKPGEMKHIEMPVAKLYTNTDMSMPVVIYHGKKAGPTVFVSAAIHGDELNGIEIIRRLMKQKNFRISKGTLILVPIVNIYGVLNQSRYLPDRRDLNRSFPGSSKGSLASRVADKFLNDIVSLCNYGIDLHTGAIHRTNLPQIRADLKDEETRELAEVFGVPVMLNSDLRDGSLRQSAVESGTKILLYEAGEALRFDELSIRAGVKGVMNVLSHLGLIIRKSRRRKTTPFIANNSTWMRASASGIVQDLKQLGDSVLKDENLAKIFSPMGEELGVVKASKTGIIIGKQNIPLVQEGEAMFHVAYFSEDEDAVVEEIERMQDTLLPEY